tara:strand:- start:124 stop:696 length:573 start_codon:yes stop_codon:yes gene_type:complete
MSLALWLMSTLASAASTTYSFSRDISSGTAVGFIETDGTLGVLSDANILGWGLTLTAPNLDGGPTDSFGSDTQFVTPILGTATTATASQLFFDFDSATPARLLLFGGLHPNFWCLEAANTSCASAFAGERIGRSNAGATIAQAELRSGLVAFATVSAVPEPQSVAMMLAGIGLLGIMVRRGRFRRNAREQ